jgi:hypothetical protein
MTERSVAKVSHNNPVAALDVFRERTGAGDLHVIGMATNSQNIHFLISFCLCNMKSTVHEIISYREFNARQESVSGP